MGREAEDGGGSVHQWRPHFIRRVVDRSLHLHCVSVGLKQRFLLKDEHARRVLVVTVRP